MNVIDVKIRERRVAARFKEEPIELHEKQYCIVESDGDVELAKVKSKPYSWQEALPPEEELFVLRQADKDDLDIVRNNRAMEREAYRVALEKIRARDLPMALSAVERTLDGKKMRFFFTAENRIDFRELVKDLAAIYRTRIEMRQIGVRDRSKKIGGYGICGQELCCARFLQKFDPVTIRMAKEQNLALNPTKISGLCGRLMCCLGYEVKDYTEAKREFPPAGTPVETGEGMGIIANMNYVKNTVNVRLEENQMIECRLNELKILSDKK
ncbi:MAG: PSP1 domain-containing protein [Candidatus Hinthialibacter sp.]